MPLWASRTWHQAVWWSGSKQLSASAATPNNPCALGNNTGTVFSQFLGRLAWLGSCQERAVLQVTPTQPPFPPLPDAFISLSRLPWRRDLARFRKIPPLTVLKTVHCVLLQVLKDFFLLCCHSSVFTSHPPTPPLSPPKRPVLIQQNVTTQDEQEQEAGCISDFLSGFLFSTGHQRTTHCKCCCARCHALSAPIRCFHSCKSL